MFTGRVDCESGGMLGNPSPGEGLENSVSMSESEIGKGDSGSGVKVVVGVGDDAKSGNRGAGGRSEGEEVDESSPRRELTDASKENAQAVTNDDSFVIDIKPGRGIGESLDREKLCRICHLSSKRGSDTNATKVADEGSNAGNYNGDLILLGCGCKDELGMAHRRCAEVWFKLKRNRLCEICGVTAENVSGVGDNRFMEEWKDGRGRAGTSISSSDGGGFRQPFCNFLMACVVMAFILPLFFFRVNLF